jgi:hypothetical protein
MLDVDPTRVELVGDVPLDEEGPRRGQSFLEACNPPCESLASGGETRHGRPPQTKTAAHGIDVFGAKTHPSPIGDICLSQRPRTERALTSLLTIDHGKELDISSTERDDPVRRPMARVSASLHGDQPMLSLEPDGGIIEVCDT